MYRTSWCRRERDTLPLSQRNEAPPPWTCFIRMNVTIVANSTFKYVARVWKDERDICLQLANWYALIWNKLQSILSIYIHIIIHLSRHQAELHRNTWTFESEAQTLNYSEHIELPDSCSLQKLHSMTIVSLLIGGTPYLKYLDSSCLDECFLLLSPKHISLYSGCNEEVLQRTVYKSYIVHLQFPKIEKSMCSFSELCDSSSRWRNSVVAPKCSSESYSLTFSETCGIFRLSGDRAPDRASLRVDSCHCGVELILKQGITMNHLWDYIVAFSQGWYEL